MLDKIASTDKEILPMFQLRAVEIPCPMVSGRDYVVATKEVPVIDGFTFVGVVGWHNKTYLSKKSSGWVGSMHAGIYPDKLNGKDAVTVQAQHYNSDDITVYVLYIKNLYM